MKELSRKSDVGLLYLLGVIIIHGLVTLGVPSQKLSQYLLGYKPESREIIRSKNKTKQNKIEIVLGMWMACPISRLYS